MSKKDKAVDGALKWAVSRVQAGIDTASPAVQGAAQRAGHELADGVASLTPKLQRSLGAVGPRISSAVDTAGPKLQKQLDRATPALNSARDKVVGDYIPAAQLKLGDVAALAAKKLGAVQTPEQLDLIVAKLTGDKKAMKKAQKALVDAAKTTSKKAKRSSGKTGKGWLVLGALAAAAVAGVSAWRASQPVEDPWKTPQPATARVTTTISAGDGKHVADTTAPAAGPVTPAPDAQVTSTTPVSDSSKA
ncbi:hypothetical protein BKD30_13360 [Tersicoccus phoenicis]|uniref:Uncharacterized protein n=1 Tax=Tersicoccus phoenicis TaxID=554083 RepID=A0A1R1L6Z7_9MICC|nr:hypothetical protein [Tersicoccus phoenicis]OMH23320.1 hypothetical protein BKD30_13360 [Tersicoccus phoenicis]